MNILIADPDRDFLMSFKNLLELSDNTVQTVFDGTQVISIHRIFFEKDLEIEKHQ